MRLAAGGRAGPEPALAAAPASSPVPSPASALPLEAAVSQEARQQITQLLTQIDALNGTEKLLLYLKLPTGPPQADPLKQPVNPLGSRAEIHQTVMWIQTHLEVDPEISLPKQDVYKEYTDYCASTKMKALSTADFGKVMKQVYPCVKPRRLGTRGNSRYCYAGMRNRVKLEAPQLPDLGEKPKTNDPNQSELLTASSQLIREWAESILGNSFGSLCELAHYLIEKKIVSNSTAASILSQSTAEPNEISELLEKNSSYDSIPSDKDDNAIPKNKKVQKGVIKRLKRKIQSQPQNSELRNTPTACSKNVNENEVDTTTPLQSHEIGSNTSVTNFSIKQECDAASSEYHNNQPIPYTVRKSEDYPEGKGFNPPVNNTVPQALHPFIGQPRENFSNAAVNLAPSYNPRPRYSMPMGSVKNPNMPLRCVGDPYKFDNNYNSDAINPHGNIFPENYPNHLLESPALSNMSFSHSNVPINLSNNSDPADSAKSYKSSIFKKNFKPHSIKCENDSLNLSTTNRNNWKLPLPGKKMILEAYNNENQMNSTQPYVDSKNMNKSCLQNLLTPTKIADFNHAEYLPKKMRATESFSNKLTTTTRVPVPQGSLDKEKPGNVGDSFGNPSNIPVNPNQMQLKPNDEYLAPTNYLMPENYLDAKACGDRLHQSDLKKLPRCKAPKKPGKVVTSAVNVGLAEKASRGRPRKRTLSKAKYTRRQVKPKIDQINQIVTHKRSSDSCCSLTDINIKTGVICRENHSEILNRERMSSICALDKHALDDYLNESNSQEHEEEIMKYFQCGTDNQSFDENKPSQSSNDEAESPLKCLTPTQLKMVAENPDPGESLVNRVKSNLSMVSNDGDEGRLNQNLDIDDHSQGKSSKLSKLRELLAKNLNYSSAAPVPVHEDQDGNKPFTVFNQAESESAFTSISRRNVEDGPNCTPMKSVDRPSAIHSSLYEMRRKVNDNSDAISLNEHNSPTKHQGMSPNVRKDFSFVPISSGPLSPVNKAVSYDFNKVTSPNKNAASLTSTSPISHSSTASPFVSPRITPVPRAKNLLHINSGSKLPNKKLGRLAISKSLYDNASLQNQGLKNTHDFIIPNEQNAIPRSPNFTTKSRNFTMSAPPSPNILNPKHKLSFNVQSQNMISTNIQSVIQMHTLSQPHFSAESMGAQTPDSMQSDQSQPLSADPLSHEVSQFFSDSISLDGTNSLRSQSVPLHQNHVIPESGLMYFNQDHPETANGPINYLSYNNTPCSSIPPTPVPREFCDFGNLNETCDSLTKVGLNPENLDRIYNVLDSSTQQALADSVGLKQNVLLESVNDDNIDMANFPPDNGIRSSLLSVSEDLRSMVKQMPYPNQISNVFCETPHSGNDYLKRSNSVEIDAPMENRFFSSRSVPSTPLPCTNLTMPDFTLAKNNMICTQLYQKEYDQSCKKTLTSKSVPSTPHSADDRNIFSYSNRDFLINGNSVDHNISTTFDDKKGQGESLSQGFLDESGNLLDKRNAVLTELTNSPIPGNMDIVNNELTPFNDCMDIASELPTFTEQGIDSGNDFLEDLGMM